MSGGAKAKQQSAQGASAPARSLAPSNDAKKPGTAKGGAKRKLPIRSSPVSTAPSLRTTLASLHDESVKACASRTPARAPLPFARKAVLQELEPRLLLSADLNPLATDALLATPSTLPAEFRSLTDEGRPSVVTSAAVAPIQRSNELVFVDTATPDYQKLVEDMRDSAAAAGRRLEFVLIDSERDGVAKITETLAQRKNLDAVHIVSHAQDGAVQLGNTQLDFETLLKRAGQIKGWGDALTQDGDILFYGCDLAATQQGQSLLEALSRLTGADVAASEDKTGSAAQGGDWELEFKTGAIESPIILGLPAQGEWDHLLATFTVTNTNDAGGGSLRAAIASAEATGAIDTIAFNIGPVGSVQTITLTSGDLENINNPVIIDGWTQGGGGYAGPPLIELNGASLPFDPNFDGLTLDAGSGGSTIRGLAIINFDGDGIELRTAGNTIVGNNVGVRADGTTAAGNGRVGVSLSDPNADNNTIGGTGAGQRNVISASLMDGVQINGGSGNLLRGNYIGTNATGTATIGNVQEGIRLLNGATGNVVGGVGEGNVVAGNVEGGIRLTGAGTDGNRVQG
jgi:hypothetical protein